MCGIIAAFNTQKNKKDTNESIIEQYEKQFERGVKGFGIIRISKDKKYQIDRAREPNKFLLDLYLKPSRMIIAHHRTPSSSENTLEQTHPIVISNKILKNDYLFVHNGVITNDTELMKKHKKLGFKYSTIYTKEYYHSSEEKFNDSESLGIEIALFIERKQKHIEIDNKAAFVMLQINKKTNKTKKIFFGRNEENSDLKIYKRKGLLEISSEGKGKDVQLNKLFSFKTNDDKMELSSRKIIFKEKEKKASTPYYDYSTFRVNRKTEDTKTKTKKEKTEKKETKKEKAKEKESPRIWQDQENPDPVFDINTTYEKGYEETILAEFQKEIKEKSAEGTFNHLEKTFSREIEKIEEIIQDYRARTLVLKINQNTHHTFLSQISRILKTIQSLVNQTEIEYNEKKLIENQDKEEFENFYKGNQEIELLNSGEKDPYFYEGFRHNGMY